MLAGLVLLVVAGATWLYKNAYSKGLLAGAFLSGLTYAATQTDPRTSRSWLAFAIVSYLVFHVSFYWSVTTIHRLGDKFFMITFLITAGVFLGASRISGSASFWDGLTGLSCGWSTIPIHLAIVALVVWFIRISNDPAIESTDMPLLPITSHDIRPDTEQQA